MELIFQDKTLEIKGIQTIENIIEKMNELLVEDYYFSHFIVNGIEVLEHHEDYLNDHINDIETIEIIAKTVEVFVNESLLSAEDYTERARPELESLAEAFYDNPNTGAWDQFSQLIEGLQWLNDMLTVVGESAAKPSNWEVYIQISNQMQEELKNLEEAMKNEDNILIGDIIQYEIIENFKALNEIIKKTIDTEGTRYDLN